MKIADWKREPEQLTLFERRPIRTSWDALPARTRQEVIQLLAKMFLEADRDRGCRSTIEEGEVL